MPFEHPAWYSGATPDGNRASAQTAPPLAVDVTAADIGEFIDQLPPNRISDRPIRVADVGNFKVGVYGVFRPQSIAGNAIRHQVR